MKKIFFFLLVTALGLCANAQVTKASLQASGLTCSMCSKAVKEALEKVSFVEKIQVDIKNQQYNMTFKSATEVDLDALSKAVEDAGFSVASLKVTANVDEISVKKDEHVKIGNHYFHFLNAKDQKLKGTASFSVVDKQFVSAKEFKKYSALTQMQCVKTGKAEGCCSSADTQQGVRVYHVII